MKRLLLVVAAAAALLAPCSDQGLAQEPGDLPVLVVCLRSYDAFLENVNYVGSKAIMDDATFLGKIAKLTTAVTGGEAIEIDKAEGIDRSKPLGMAIYSHGSSVRQLSFMAATDPEAVFAWLKPVVGEVSRNDAGIYEIKSDRVTAFVKVDNGWMVWAFSPDHLDDLPDPLKAFDDLPGRYAAAMRVNFGNVPEDLRSIAIDQLRARLESAEVPAGESPAQSALRKETSALAGRMLDRIAHEAEHVTMGANFAEGAPLVNGQLVVKPTAGASLAKHVSELGPQTTRFGGLFTAADKPVLSLGMTGPLMPEAAADFKAELEAYRNAVFELIEASPDVPTDEDRQLFKDLGGAIVGAMQAGLDAGRLDVAVRIPMGTPLTLVAAIQVAGGDNIVKQLDRLGEATQDNANAGFKLEEAVHQSLRISSFEMPKDPELATIARIFGQGRLYVAANDSTLYMAYGAKGLDLIKQAIDCPEQQGVEPLRADGRGATLVRLIPQGGGDQNSALLMTVVTLQLGVGDQFTAVGKTAAGDLQLDFTAEKGYVRLATFIMLNLGPLILRDLDLNNLGGTFGF